MHSQTYHAIAADDEQQTVPARTRSGKSRSLMAALMLTICIASFVLQTELAQYVQRTTNYQKPYFILYVSYSFPFSLSQCNRRTFFACA